MIIGNLTRDPEIRNTPDGTPVTSFSVATNFTWKDQNGQKQERPEYHNVVAWRKLAEICGQYLKKGSKIYAEGRLQTHSWDDQSGNKRYRTEIILDNMIMLDRPAGRPRDENDSGSSQTAPAENQPTGAASEEIINVEEIPF